MNKSAARLVWLFVLLLLAGCSIELPATGCEREDYSCALSPRSDGTVWDPEAGLLWQRGQAPEAQTWPQSVAYCADLELGSTSRWRLPTTTEYGTIVNRNPRGKINRYIFQPLKEFYWTQTSGGTYSRISIFDTQLGQDGNLDDDLVSAEEKHYTRCIASLTFPVVNLPETAVQIAAGFEHSCALLADNTIHCWGSNAVGQLGDGTRKDAITPVRVAGLTDGEVTQLASGYWHTCAVFKSGGLQCWGYNQDSQLGDGTTEDRDRATTVAGLAGVTAVAPGAYHTCSLQGDGGVRCWGYGELGALGDGLQTTSQSPVTPTSLASGVSMLSAGMTHTCALLSDGEARCWGLNKSGELGDGTTKDRLEPASVDFSGKWKHIGAGGSVRGKVPAGITCGIDGSDVTWCWGANEYGQLGIGASGTGADQYRPVKVDSASSFVSTAPGGAHACAVEEEGKLFCWGSNGQQQLADSTPFNRMAPVQTELPPAEYATAVATGLEHTCAIDEGGMVYCWGGNAFGQLGR